MFAGKTNTSSIAISNGQLQINSIGARAGGSSRSSLGQLFANQQLTSTSAATYMYSDTDPLITSCVEYIRREFSQFYSPVGLTSASKSSSPTACDYDQIMARSTEMASNIRAYYSQKAVVWTLSEGQISSFRHDLVKFITETTGPEWRWNSKNSGMIYRLPEFYNYDLEVDRLWDMEPIGETVQISHGKLQKLTLWPVKMLRRDTRSGNLYQYWFFSGNTKIVLNVAKNNMLHNLFSGIWTSCVRRGVPLTVNAICAIRRTDNKKYAVLNNWELANVS